MLASPASDYGDSLELEMGAWVAQLVKRTILAQVMISQSEFRPYVRFCAERSEARACFRVCLPFSDPPPLISYYII